MINGRRAGGGGIHLVGGKGEQEKWLHVWCSLFPSHLSIMSSTRGLLFPFLIEINFFFGLSKPQIIFKKILQPIVKFIYGK